MTTVGRAPVPMLDRLALPLLLLLALALRVREAVRAPLWFDELYTRAAVERPWPEVMRIVRADVHPPLHFVVTHAWRLFGDSDLAVRSSSLVFAMATNRKLPSNWTLIPDLVREVTASLGWIG